MMSARNRLKPGIAQGRKQAQGSRTALARGGSGVQGDGAALPPRPWERTSPCRATLQVGSQGITLDHGQLHLRTTKCSFFSYLLMENLASKSQGCSCARLQHLRTGRTSIGGTSWLSLCYGPSPSLGQLFPLKPGSFQTCPSAGCGPSSVFQRRW